MKKTQENSVTPSQPEKFTPRQLINFCMKHPEKKVTDHDIRELLIGSAAALFSIEKGEALLFNL